LQYIQDEEAIVLPDYSNQVHYEGELVVVIDKYCADISADEAWDYIARFALALSNSERFASASKAKRHALVPC
jgi:2-keto-4-pentenoate hydratase/2-oxohepta-3-ene-1,7-dioic acid hydratase in catechol pathway